MKKDDSFDYSIVIECVNDETNKIIKDTSKYTYILGNNKLSDSNENEYNAKIINKPADLDQLKEQNLLLLNSKLIKDIDSKSFVKKICESIKNPDKTYNFYDNKNNKTLVATYLPKRTLNRIIPDFTCRNTISFDEITKIIQLERINHETVLTNFTETGNSKYFKAKLKPIEVINHIFINPIKIIKERKHNSNIIFRLLFGIIAVSLFISMPLMSLDAGVSGDEDKHVNQAKKVYNYFQSGGDDESYKDSKWGPFYAYNITYDVFLSFLIDKLDIENYYDFRHIVNSLLGALTIFIVGLITVMISGWRAGVLSMLILFLTPSFVGHSFNNPKDIPFALSYVLGIFFILKMVRNYPIIRIKDIILLSLAIGFSLNIRIGGLILIPYMVMFIGLKHLIITPGNKLFGKESLNKLKTLIITLAGISLAGYFLGLIFWPYGLEDPIKHPFKSFEIMSNFTISLRQIFEGKFVWSDKVPWYYALKYISISAPILLFIGLTLFIVFIRKVINKNKGLFIFIIAFSALFPVAYLIYKGSNVYGGWRHLLFAYSFGVILASFGLNMLIESIKNKKLLYIVYTFILLFISIPLIHIIRNHPHQYIYYNQFVGGIDGAYGNYETDYYYHSSRAGINYLINNYLKEHVKNNDSVTVAVNHSPGVYKHYLKKNGINSNIRMKYTRYYEKGNHNWDYAIFVNSYINPNQLEKDNWPTKNAIHTINVDNSPICAILKRNSKADYLGYQAIQNGNKMQAINHYKKALEIDNKNETAIINLANVYSDLNMFIEAEKTARNGLKLIPEWDRLLNTLGVIYMKQNKFKQALGVFNKLTKINYKYYTGYYNIALILLQQNDNYKAMKYAEKCIRQNGKYKPAYYLMAEALKRLGKKQEAQRYIEFANKKLK